MRVLLDAHVSSRHIGRPLQAAGHDVLAIDLDPELRSLADEDILTLATQRERIVVTHNVKDFLPLARTWAEAGRHHAGCVVIQLRHDAYGPILRGLRAVFNSFPRQEDWRDRIQFLASAEAAVHSD